MPKPLTFSTSTAEIPNNSTMMSSCKFIYYDVVRNYSFSKESRNPISKLMEIAQSNSGECFKFWDFSTQKYSFKIVRKINQETRHKLTVKMSLRDLQSTPKTKRGYFLCGNFAKIQLCLFIKLHFLLRNERKSGSSS